MKNVLLSTGLLCVMLGYSGCSIDKKLYPGTFQTTEGLYASKPKPVGGNYKVGNYELQPIHTFDAGYDDVFQALKTGTVQALLIIKHYDENSGMILAERTINVQGAPWRYSYAFFVKEKGRKVTIYATSQRQRNCVTLDHGIGWDIGTIGVATATAAMQNQCKKDVDSRRGDFEFDKMTSDRVISYTANNLIAAGAL